MCKRRKNKQCQNRIDNCMKGLIKFLSRKNSIHYHETLACCCGHDKHPMTIVVKNKHGLIYDLVSLKVIPRKRRFYVRDKKGVYFIPETKI